MKICDICGTKESVTEHSITHDGVYYFKSGDFCDLCWKNIMTAFRFTREHVKEVLKFRENFFNGSEFDSDPGSEGSRETSSEGERYSSSLVPGNPSDYDK